MSKLSPRRALVLAVERAKQQIVTYQKATAGSPCLTEADKLHNATVVLWQAAEAYLKNQKGAESTK